MKSLTLFILFLFVRPVAQPEPVQVSPTLRVEHKLDAFNDDIQQLIYDIENR